MFDTTSRRGRTRFYGEHLYLPPGWPASVPAPNSDDWLIPAVGFLLDLCPPEYRGYRVLQRYPAALGWLAEQHIASQIEANAEALSQYRVACLDSVPSHALPELLNALQTEQARLLRVLRAVQLLNQALAGARFIEPL